MVEDRRRIAESCVIAVVNTWGGSLPSPSRRTTREEIAGASEGLPNVVQLVGYRAFALADKQSSVMTW